ncbi:MAG: septation protein IspZ [Betaproteobacteria bacterium]
MKLWTYRFKPVIDGHEVPVALETSWTWSRLVVHPPGAGATPLSDRQDYFKDPYRLHEVALDGPGGALRFVVGPRTAWSYGLKVIRADQTLWQSHDSPHAYLGKMQDMMTSRRDGKPVFEGSSFKRNAPSIITDIALGLLFFIIGKTSDLRTAALVTAAVGLSLVPIQWLINRFAPRKLDLLGGLALFGVLMMLLSAGFSWYFESEFAVQLKATIMGCIAASCFAVDALSGGRYMARRLSTYLAYRDLNLRRLSIGMAACGFTMAGINLAVALNFSKDIWLYYTTWGDFVVVIVLTQWALNWSRTAR